MFCEVNTDHMSRTCARVSIHKMRVQKFALSCLHLPRCEKRPYSGGKLDKYFGRLLSDSESDETNTNKTPVTSRLAS